MRPIRLIAGFLLAAAVAAAGAADYRLSFDKFGVGQPDPVQPAPELSLVTPAQGPTAGGTVFTLSGDNFQPGASVMIGGAPATGVNWTSAFELTAHTPAHTWGLADITLVNPDNQSTTLFNAFRFIAPAPAVLAATPGSGSDLGGSAIAVTGSGFLEGAQVLFGETPASTTFVSDAEVAVTTPAHRWGLTDITLVNPDGQQNTLTGGYLFTHNAPTLTALSPTSGSTAGGPLTLTGAEFLDGATVQVDGESVSTVFVSATELTATLPAHGWGEAQVHVLNADGTLTAALPYTFVAPPPSLSSVTPNSGSDLGGDTIIVSGAGFLDGAQVRFGEITASTTFVSETELTTTTPAHAWGPAHITVLNPDEQQATLEGGFQFNHAAPTLTALDPVSGPTAGGPLILTGTNFLDGAQVQVDGESVSTTFVSETGLTAALPAHDWGEAQIQVLNADEQLTEALTYSFIAPAPTVLAAMPGTGSDLGGDTVTVSGTGFLDGAQVRFGETLASTTFVSETELTVITPAHAWGFADITVLNPDEQQSSLEGGFQFAHAAPTLTGLNPISGPTAGSTLTLTGTQFLDGATVYVDGQPVPTTFVSATQLTAALPAHNWGASLIHVVNADDAQTNSLPYSFVAPAPTVQAAAPNSGSDLGGSVITVSGTGFLDGAQVHIGATAASATFVSGTQLTVTTPAHGWGWTDIMVTNPDGQRDSLTNGFRFDHATPTLSALNPASGSTAGGTITVTGTQFLDGATVQVDGVSVGTSFVSATQLTATLPAHSWGTAQIRVVNADGQTTAAQTYTYVAPAPTLSTTEPSNGSDLGGDIITVSGSGFLEGAQVRFGTTAASTTFVSGTQLTVTTPAHAWGWADVTVINPDGQQISMAYGFRFDHAAPTLASLNPTNGPTAGGTITLAGTQFLNGATVQLNGSPVQTTFVSATQLTATLPPRQWGSYMVRVVNADGQATDSLQYVFDAPAPTLSSVTPNIGSVAGGTTVTLIGSGFFEDALVRFGNTLISNPTVVSSTQITLTVPAHVAGTVDVRVFNADGQVATLAGGYTYEYPAPTVSSVSPATGLTTGGSSVTITGTNFRGGATVKFGSASATGVTVHSATQITATSPSGSAGAVSVTVTNNDGKAATKANAFTYEYPAPTVSSVSPATGLTTGGTSVTISGTNFRGGATVKFGSASASSVTVHSATQITATSPSGSAGTVSVTVTNNDAKAATKASAFTYELADPIVITWVTGQDMLMSMDWDWEIIGSGFVAGATVRVISPNHNMLASIKSLTGSRIVVASNQAWRNGWEDGAGVTVIVTNPNGAQATGYSFYDPTYDGW